MTDFKALLLRNAQNVFYERSALRRDKALAAMWTEDCVFRTSEGTFFGRSQVGEHISSLLGRAPEYDFAVVGAPNEIEGAAYIQWVFGDSMEKPAISGTDFVVLNGSLITLACRFLNGPVW